MFHLKLDEPDLGAIVSRRVAQQDDLEQRFVEFELDWVMELGNQRAQFLEEGHTDLLEVLLGATFANIATIRGAKVRDVAIEPNGPGLRSDLPLRCAKKDADVAAIDGSDARRNGFGFEGMIDARENNGAVGHVNERAATGKVGDDFVFLSTGGSAGWERAEENQGGAKDKVIHGGRVAQCAGSGAGRGSGMVSEHGGIR